VLPAGLAKACLRPGLTKTGQRIRFTTLAALAISLAGLLSACESLSPLAREDRQASVLDDLNFEVPKRRPVTRKDDPVGSAAGQAGSGLTQPIIVAGTGPAGQAPGMLADEGEAIYRVNFDNADLREAVASILGETLGLEYLIDPNVSGTVTLGTTEPVTRNALLRMLDFALRMNGAAMIYDGAIVRVVPEEVARTTGLRIGTEPLIGYGITVLPLQFASAANVARTMAAIFTSPGAVVADDRSNSLVLTGSADDRQAMIDLAMTFDVDWMSGKSIGLFPLRNAAPDPVARELEAIFADAIGDVPPSFIRFLPITRLSAVMVVASEAGLLSEAQAWVERLDKGNQSERTIRVYYVKNGKATDLANTLSRVFTGLPAPPSGPTAVVGPTGAFQAAPADGGFQTMTSQPGATGDLAQQSSQDGTGEPPQDPDFVSATSDVAAPDEGAAVLVAGQPTVGGPQTLRVIADAANNSLLIFGTPAEHDAVEKALQRLDILPLQVLIEATIAEVTLNDQLKYGVEYYFNSQRLRGAARGEGLSIAGIGSLLTTGIAPGLNLLINPGDGPDIVITALSALTDVKVISSPQVVVQDNRTALLKVGDQVPVTVQQAVSIEDPDAPLVNSIQYVDTGVILRVTPRINSGGLVTCDVEQEVSSVSSDSLTGVLTPTISIRKIRSTVSVQSGQTVALGGLISESRNDNSTGLPGLSRVPVIGGLFGTKDQGLTRTELIVFITPRVIGSAEDARDVTQELRSRLWSLRSPSTTAPTTSAPTAPGAPQTPSQVPGPPTSLPSPAPVPSSPSPVN
jgi:general secretion pathway protein D